MGDMNSMNSMPDMGNSMGDMNNMNSMPDMGNSMGDMSMNNNDSGSAQGRARLR
jgi:hypothetical protein